MGEKINFVAVDLGASSGRVLLSQWDGSRFSLQELHRFANGPVTVNGSLFWDVLYLWAQTKIGLTRYASEFDQPLAGIGVDTWGVDFGLLDAAGHLLGNPYHYRDSRTDGMVARACELAGRRRMFEQTGLQFMQPNTVFQVLSMVEAHDPRLEIADTYLMIPDLLNYWLTGRKVCEYTIASTSHMMDARERRWAVDLLADLHIPTHFLPPIIAPGTAVGELLPEVMAETRLRQAVPVIAPGSHDTASAVAGIPDLDSESMYISSGTWSLVGVEIKDPIINDMALSLNFANEGGVANDIRLLKNVSGLWLLQESRRQWQREGQDYSWEALLGLAEQAEPFRTIIDPDVTDFLGPGDMPGAIRAYCRRVGQPEPEGVGQVVRCCLESLALRYRWILERLETLTGRRLTTIRVVGGGSQNHLLCQLTADACQRPVVAGPVEATALGNVMVQAIALGYLPNVTAGRKAIAASVERQYFEPRSVAGWDEAFARFERLLS